MKSNLLISKNFSISFMNMFIYHLLLVWDPLFEPIDYYNREFKPNVLVSERLKNVVTIRWCCSNHLWNWTISVWGPHWSWQWKRLRHLQDSVHHQFTNQLSGRECANEGVSAPLFLFPKVRIDVINKNICILFLYFFYTWVSEDTYERDTDGQAYHKDHVSLFCLFSLFIGPSLKSCVDY